MSQLNRAAAEARLPLRRQQKAKADAKDEEQADEA